MRPEKERWTIRDVQLAATWLLEHSARDQHTCPHLAAVTGLFVRMMAGDVFDICAEDLSPGERVALERFAALAEFDHFIPYARQESARRPETCLRTLEERCNVSCKTRTHQ